MTDCVFLLADLDMEGTFRGFLNRPKYHLALQTRPFEYEIKRAANKDPGVYNEAHIILHSYRRTHRYAMVVLDEAWSGSPGADRIRDYIQGNLVRTGWDEDRIAVIVIRPELEAWVLHDSPHFASAFRFTQHNSVRQWLVDRGLWNPNDIKCGDPKKAIEEIARVTKTSRSSTIYQRITSQISVKGCTDASFLSLCDQLRIWFPASGIS